MNRSMLISALMLGALSVAACDRPTVVVPAATVAVPVEVPVAVPGPPGPQGATGNQGNDGTKGDTGKPGGNTTVIVVPPAASAPTN